MTPAGIRAEVETVTPAIASALLSSMKSQRKPMLSHVDFLASQIGAGRWGLNGQSLILSDEGALLDGQHRCMAVIRAAKAIRTLVVRGVDAEQFATMDTGVVRSSTHVLQVRGRTDCNNLAAALRLLANYRDGRFTGSSARATNQRILDLDESNPEMGESVKWAHGCYYSMREGHVWKVPAAAFARDYMLTLDEKAAERFCALLVTGKGPTIGWPGAGALGLRERLERAYRTHERLVLQEVLASFVLAWNARGGSVDWKDLVWRRPMPGKKGTTAFPHFGGTKGKERVA